MDNQAEENPAMQQRQESGNKEKRDVEPSTATPTIKDPPGRLYLKRLTMRDYKRPRNEGSLRTFWRCSSRSKSISHFWTPSNSAVICQVLERLDHCQEEDECPEEGVFDRAS